MSEKNCWMRCKPFWRNGFAVREMPKSCTRATQVPKREVPKDRQVPKGRHY